MAKASKSTGGKSKVLWTPERRAAFSRAQKARWAAKQRAAQVEQAVATVRRETETQAATLAPPPARSGGPQIAVKVLQHVPGPLPSVRTLRDIIDLIDTLAVGEEILLTRLA